MLMLGEVLLRLPILPLNEQQFGTLLTFFLERLKDAPTVEGTMKGINALLKHHLRFLSPEKAPLISEALFSLVHLQTHGQALRSVGYDIIYRLMT
jgi:hypothetical protein